MSILRKNSEEMYQEALSERFSPSRDQSEVLMNRGRYRPPGNHHLAVIDHFADKYDANEVHLIIQASNRKTASNPYTGEQVASIFNDVSDERDLGYDIIPHVHDPSENFFGNNEMINLWERNPILFTRDPEHVWLAALGSRLYNPATTFIANNLVGSDLPEDGGFGIDFEPRFDTAPYSDFDGECCTSSTELREMIPEGGYKPFVPEEAYEIIETDEDAEQAIREGKNGSHKWLELFTF